MLHDSTHFGSRFFSMNKPCYNKYDGKGILSSGNFVYKGWIFWSEISGSGYICIYNFETVDKCYITKRL